MALHFSDTKSFSRKDGKSAVASVAYRAGENLFDARQNKTHNYSKRYGVMSADIILPSKFSDQNIKTNRQEIWNKAEQSEKRKDARVAREWLINLPYELDEETRKKLAHSFAQKLADRYNVLADCCIHQPTKKEIAKGADPRNFHAHIMLTTRELEIENGEIVFTKKSTAELSDTDRKKLGLCRMSDELKQVKELWDNTANPVLFENGFGAMDCRSYAEMGLDITPQIKVGVHATAMERKGKETELGNRNRAIKQRNEIVFNRELTDIKQANDLADQIIFESRKQEDELRELNRFIEESNKQSSSRKRAITDTDKFIERATQTNGQNQRYTSHYNHYLETRASGRNQREQCYERISRLTFDAEDRECKTNRFIGDTDKFIERATQTNDKYKQCISNCEHWLEERTGRRNQREQRYERISRLTFNAEDREYKTNRFIGDTDKFIERTNNAINKQRLERESQEREREQQRQAELENKPYLARTLESIVKSSVDVTIKIANIDFDYRMSLPKAFEVYKQVKQNKYDPMGVGHHRFQQSIDIRMPIKRESLQFKITEEFIKSLDYPDTRLAEKFIDDYCNTQIIDSEYSHFYYSSDLEKSHSKNAELSLINDDYKHFKLTDLMYSDDNETTCKMRKSFDRNTQQNLNLIEFLKESAIQFSEKDVENINNIIVEKVKLEQAKQQLQPQTQPKKPQGQGLENAFVTYNSASPNTEKDDSYSPGF